MYPKSRLGYCRDSAGHSAVSAAGVPGNVLFPIVGNVELPGRGRAMGNVDSMVRSVLDSAVLEWASAGALTWVYFNSVAKTRWPACIFISSRQFWATTPFPEST